MRQFTMKDAIWVITFRMTFGMAYITASASLVLAWMVFLKAIS